MATSSRTAKPTPRQTATTFLLFLRPTGRLPVRATPGCSSGPLNLPRHADAGTVPAVQAPPQQQAYGAYPAYPQQQWAAPTASRQGSYAAPSPATVQSPSAPAHVQPHVAQHVAEPQQWTAPDPSLPSAPPPVDMASHPSASPTSTTAAFLWLRPRQLAQQATRRQLWPLHLLPPRRLRPLQSKARNELRLASLCPPATVRRAGRAGRRRRCCCPRRRCRPGGRPCSCGAQPVGRRAGPGRTVLLCLHVPLRSRRCSRGPCCPCAGETAGGGAPHRALGNEAIAVRTPTHLEAWLSTSLIVHRRSIETLYETMHEA
jgi:hypothetical protein